MNSSHDVTVLNDLIESVIDSADGYERAAGDIRGGDLRQMFLERAAERNMVVGELQAGVRDGGSFPETSGSILAGAHRWFETMKSKLAKGDDTTIIEDIEQAETYLKSKFEAACNDRALSIEGRNIVQRCNRSIRGSQQRMAEPG